jgi:hypothetical protein
VNPTEPKWIPIEIANLPPEFAASPGNDIVMVGNPLAVDATQLLDPLELLSRGTALVVANHQISLFTYEQAAVASFVALFVDGGTKAIEVREDAFPLS